jgi:hypothetical protein
VLSVGVRGVGFMTQGTMVIGQSRGLTHWWEGEQSERCAKKSEVPTMGEMSRGPYVPTRSALVGA